MLKNYLISTFRVSVISILLLISLFTNAQNTISGVIKDIKGNPLQTVTVLEKTQLKWAVTNAKGFFEIKNINTENITLVCSRLGLREQALNISFKKDKKQNIEIVLLEESLSLDEINITAIKRKNKASTIIKSQAIQHLQANSLADVIQLLPGQLAGNQHFDEVKQLLLRQDDTRDGAEDATSFGTNIRINGIIQSNNANLQNASSSLRGNVNFFKSVAARGLDLRQIATDNIDKIEIIKGIPSVIYGDLTSGVVLIETKKGHTPWRATQRINPKVYQTTLGKGFSLKNNSTLNIDLDYTKAIQNEREKDLNYNKMRGSAVFVSPLFKYKDLQSTTSLTVDHIFDGNNNDNASTLRKSEQTGFQFGFNTNWYAQKKWAKKLTFNLATSYSSQFSFNREIVNKPLSILSLFTTNNEGEGLFLPQTYTSEISVKGKPFTFYSKITNEFLKNIATLKNHFLVGMEYNLEQNFGNGVSFNPQRPPEGLGFQTLRERPYNQVPALQQIALFAQDNIKFRLLNAKSELTVGLRLDNFQPNGITTSRYSLQASPRINFLTHLSNKLLFRTGWGIATKAPSLLFLYPDKAYYDLVSLNYFTGNPNENLVIMNTSVFNTENKNLKVAKNNKFEVGFNYSWQKNSIDITAYSETTKNAFGYNQTPAFVNYNIYQIDQDNPNAQPDYSLLETSNYISTYSTPNNNFTIENKGIELQADINPKRSLFSFQLNGAYLQTASINTNNNHSIYVNPTTGSQLIGKYKKGYTNKNIRFNTSLRTAVHIPELKFIVSLLTQTIWQEKQIQENYASTPYQYAEGNGVFKDFIANEIPEDALQQFTRDNNNITNNTKPLWLFNLNITKEIGKRGKLSFFANNLFNSRPIINNTPRNIPFFYGLEATLKI